MISGTAGLVAIGVDLVFAIWASIGKMWYTYPLNLILLFIASSAINTPYIQGLTRGVSYIYLYGVKGVSKALKVNILTIISILIAYFVTKFVFSASLQYILFFVGCVVLSTIVAFIDNQFRVAIERTKVFENIKKD